MKLLLTSMSGTTSLLNLNTTDEVHDFIALYPKHIDKSLRVRVTCDILGIDGWLQGEA
jgi:hypothetical protein